MEFSIDIKGLDAVKRMLDPKLIKKAEPRALNKTGKMARTEQSKEIRKTYNITAKRLNEELEKVSGPNRATVSKPRAIIRVKKLTKRNPGLQHYGAKQLKKGVSYRIRKDKGRQTLPHAFTATMSRGAVGVFVRIGKKRLPIIRKTGPSVFQMMERVGIGPIKRSVKDNFPRLFSHEYKRELVRFKR